MTKEKHYRADHAEQTDKCMDKCADKCKACKQGMLIGTLTLSTFACLFALVAGIFSILAFVAAKKITPTNLGSLQSQVEKMYAFTVNQNGGETSFQKLNQFYASADIQQSIASQIDAMIGQDA